MTDLQQCFRRFLTTEIPDMEREDMNKAYGINLGPGSTFLDALAARAAQFAERSEQWAELARQFEEFGGGGDG